jgi:hypothetical protein
MLQCVSGNGGQCEPSRRVSTACTHCITTQAGSTATDVAAQTAARAQQQTKQTNI